MRRVVITGIGAITPIGNTYDAYVEGLKNGGKRRWPHHTI